MDGQEIDALQPRPGPGQIVDAGGGAIRRLHPHAGVSAGSGRVVCQHTDQALQVVRLDQVVIVEEEGPVTLGGFQGAVGSLGSGQRPGVPGRGLHQTPGQPGRQEVQRAMGMSAGVDHHQFHASVRLQGHAGQRLGQAGPVHAADQHADQRHLVWVIGEPQTLADPGPLRQRGQCATCPDSLQVHLEEGLGLPAGWTQPEGAQGRHGAGMRLVVFDVELAGKAPQRTPLALGHIVEREMQVGMQRRATLVEQDGVQRGARTTRRAQPGQSGGLVIWVGLGERRQQQDLRVVLSDGSSQCLDQCRPTTQSPIGKAQEMRRRRAQFRGGALRLLAALRHQMRRCCGLRCIIRQRNSFAILA